MMAPQFAVEPMQLEDVAEVSRVERRCFSNPWPTSAYRRELRNVEQNCYIVLRGSDIRNDHQTRGRFVEDYGENWKSLRSIGLLSLARKSATPSPTARIVGFAGMWQLFDEAHITTIGVDPPFRGRGFGELMLLALMDEAMRRGANFLTLEARISNEAAIRLYEKYEFTVHGVRPRYYSDNGEDAYVMWSPSLRDAGYRDRVDALRLLLAERLKGVADVPRGWVDRVSEHSSNGVEPE